MTRISLALLSIVLVFAVACGGSDKDGGILGGGGTGGSSGGGTNDPNAFARQTVVTFLTVFSGHTDPQRMIDLYLPECRGNVKAADITQVLGMVKAFFPELSKVKVEDADLGGTKVDRNGSDVTVTITDPSKMRLKVDGKFIPANEYLKKVGFDSINDSPLEGTEDPLKLREVDGKLYITDCSELEDIGDSGASSNSATPTPQRGSTASPTPQRSSTTTAAAATATPGRTATQTTGTSATATPQRANTPATNAVVKTTPTAAQRYPNQIEMNFMNSCTRAGSPNSTCRCMLDILEVRYNLAAFTEFEQAVGRGERTSELNAVVAACT